ncbi:MAG: hypothetical protein ABJA37_12560, partial [Ferruginibacter sp.]
MVKHYLSVLFVFFISFSSFGQGIETFTSIPANSSSYSTRNWTGDNGLPWAATDSRTDLNLNGRAIGVRNGSVTCSNVPNGIGNLSFKNQQNFTGSNPVLQVYVNNILIGTASPTITVATATINNINVSGTFNLEIRQVTSGLRIAIDDVSWTSFNATPCDEPAAQPTNLLLTPTPTTVSGSFDVIPDPTTVQNYL